MVCPAARDGPVLCVGRPCGVWGGRAVCKNTGQNPGLRQEGMRWKSRAHRVTVRVEARPWGGREGARGREKKKEEEANTKEPTALPIPSWSPTEVLR